MICACCGLHSQTRAYNKQRHTAVF